MQYSANTHNTIYLAALGFVWELHIRSVHYTRNYGSNLSSCMSLVRLPLPPLLRRLLRPLQLLRLSLLVLLPVLQPLHCHFHQRYWYLYYCYLNFYYYRYCYHYYHSSNNLCKLLLPLRLLAPTPPPPFRQRNQQIKTAYYESQAPKIKHLNPKAGLLKQHQNVL